ncbi:MAG: hypothetical protein ACPG5O_04060 [Pseudoalteromonas tetraodonis]
MKEVNSHEEIKYAEVMALGFFRNDDCNDSTFFNHYGFPYFIVERQLSKRISATWDVTTRKATVVRMDKEGFIKQRINVDLKALKKLIELIDPTDKYSALRTQTA